MQEIRPNHYKLNVKGQEIEVKDIIQEVVKDLQGIKAFNVANVIKYVLRAEKKNGIEDYKKAITYLNFITQEEQWNF